MIGKKMGAVIIRSLNLLADHFLAIQATASPFPVKGEGSTLPSGSRRAERDGYNKHHAERDDNYAAADSGGAGDS
jgi:hypothetical protein